MKYKFKVVDKNDGSCIVHPKSSFYRRYSKDTNVIASPDSLGVMVFHTREHADNFISNHSQTYSDLYHRAKNWKIKRVLPIGRGKTPNLISSSPLTKNIKKFIKTINDISFPEARYDCDYPIAGTICYPGVYVID